MHSMTRDCSIVHIEISLCQYETRDLGIDLVMTFINLYLHFEELVLSNF